MVAAVPSSSGGGGDLILALAEARGKVRDALIEPELNVREDFTITEKALTRAFS